jgi:hypothetical protein
VRYAVRPAQHRKSGHVCGAAWLCPAADVTPPRIIGNFDMLGVELTDEMAKIATFDNDRGRVGPDPDLFA